MLIARYRVALVEQTTMMKAVITLRMTCLSFQSCVTAEKRCRNEARGRRLWAWPPAVSSQQRVPSRAWPASPYKGWCSSTRRSLTNMIENSLTRRGSETDRLPIDM